VVVILGLVPARQQVVLVNVVLVHLLVGAHYHRLDERPHSVAVVVDQFLVHGSELRCATDADLLFPLAVGLFLLLFVELVDIEH